MVVYLYGGIAPARFLIIMRTREFISTGVEKTLCPLCYYIGGVQMFTFTGENTYSAFAIIQREHRGLSLRGEKQLLCLPLFCHCEVVEPFMGS